MATLKTDKDKTYTIDYVVCPTYDGSCVIRMNDNRILSEIAVEFEGIHHMEYQNTDLGIDTEYNGYTVLMSIFRGINDSVVQISLRKPSGGD